jgi:DNA-binding CsgD family transcriptional regulator
MKSELTHIRTLYSLLDQQQFDANVLDRDFLSKAKLQLQNMAALGNSGISIFDMHKKAHVFYSLNFGKILGYNINKKSAYGMHFLKDKIHPNDANDLAKNGISILKLLLQFSPEERCSYKFINEYRVLNAAGVYINMIEQEQVLALDAKGNMWLTMSTIDISPNQGRLTGLQSQIFNFKTGRIVQFKNEHASGNSTLLTPRETEVLQLIKKGLLSKEISNSLFISVHTVNTHRQRILEKLQSDNAIEAILSASALGLI